MSSGRGGLGRHRSRPRRASLRLILSLVLVGSAVTFSAAEPARAAVIPTGSCVDANYGDGLDTRSAAAYCVNTLAAAGYNARALTNTDATQALETVGTDAVFYHAGHSLVVGAEPNVSAISSVFPASAGYGLTGLLGDITAADFQGPARVCTANGDCRDVVLVNYPYESLMTQVNLALFQNCNSAGDPAFGYTSLAPYAYENYGTGTSIGFHDEVSWITNSPNIGIAGDAFARRFWADLGNGMTYSTALVDAVNAGGGTTYGYGSYRMYQRPDAPKSLYPAQYWSVL